MRMDSAITGTPQGKQIVTLHWSHGEGPARPKESPTNKKPGFDSVVLHRIPQKCSYLTNFGDSCLHQLERLQETRHRRANVAWFARGEPARVSFPAIHSTACSTPCPNLVDTGLVDMTMPESAIQVMMAKQRMLAQIMDNKVILHSRLVAFRAPKVMCFLGLWSTEMDSKMHV